jgi:alpha-glucosidase
MHWTKNITGTLAALLLAAAALAGAAQTTAAKTGIVSNEKDWWKNAVLYEIYPRSFQDSNGDGVGDLNGITQRLDYLKQLGVDAIWLSPIYPSPQVDFGYDISDYENIDPQYGTLADFDHLIAEANKRHVRVIMDMVMNHSSDKHKWFIESRSSRTNPYRDWYVWHDGKGETATDKGQPPNNWQSDFGHSAWECGREDAPVLLPQVLYPAAGLQLEQSEGSPGLQRHHRVLAETRRRRFPLRRSPRCSKIRRCGTKM